MAEETPALVPVREAQVQFYGDALVAAQLSTGEIYVPLRPICDALGLSWAGQRERTLRDEILAEALRSVRVTRTEAGGHRDVLCLPLKHLAGWLFGVTTARVKPEIQDKIKRYRRDCYDALWDAFKGDILPGRSAPSQASGATLALELAEAVATLARQQIDFERRYTTMADYMRGHVRRTKAQLGDHEARLSALELQVGGGATISDEQAAEIALAVKQVAIALAAHDNANHYGEVYTALYRRFGVSSYKMIPRSQYEDVLDWLRAWFNDTSGTGDGPVGTIQ